MKFKIKLNSNVNVINIHSRKIGLRHLNIARKSVGTDFNINLLCDTIDYMFMSTVYIDVTEEEARELGVFEDSNTYNLKVDGCFLNDCVDDIMQVSRDSEDAIKEVWFEYSLNIFDAKEKVLDYIKNEVKESETESQEA